MDFGFLLMEWAMKWGCWEKTNKRESTIVYIHIVANLKCFDAVNFIILVLFQFFPAYFMRIINTVEIFFFFLNDMTWKKQILTMEYMSLLNEQNQKK